MKKTLLVCLLSSTAFSVSADVLLGGDVEFNAWQQEQTFRGNASNQEDEAISYTFEASFEHFIPFVPNPKISHSTVDGDYFKYTKVDATLYYEFLDNEIISVDAGIGVTQLTEGSINLNTTTNTTLGWKDFEGVIPHLYAAVEVGIPATPLYVFAKGTGISYEDNDMLDASVGIKVSIPVGPIDLDLQAGYRSQTFNLVGFDNLTTDVDAETSGAFAGINIDI